MHDHRALGPFLLENRPKEGLEEESQGFINGEITAVNDFVFLLTLTLPDKRGNHGVNDFESQSRRA